MKQLVSQRSTALAAVPLLHAVLLKLPPELEACRTSHNRNFLSVLVTCRVNYGALQAHLAPALGKQHWRQLNSMYHTHFMLTAALSAATCRLQTPDCCTKHHHETHYTIGLCMQGSTCAAKPPKWYAEHCEYITSPHCQLHCMPTAWMNITLNTSKQRCTGSKGLHTATQYAMNLRTRRHTLHGRCPVKQQVGSCAFVLYLVTRVLRTAHSCNAILVPGAAHLPMQSPPHDMLCYACDSIPAGAVNAACYANYALDCIPAGAVNAPCYAMCSALLVSW
jgi:hypothetical protein